MGVKKAQDLLDDDFRQSYFKQLVGRYKTLGESVVNAEARKRGNILSEMPPDKVDWNDIYELESIIVQLEADEQLRQHVWSLRAEYKRVAPNNYVAYEKSNPPDPVQTAIEKVRADAVRIQEELNWYYTVLWVQETFRGNLLKRVTKKTFKLIGIYVALGLALVISSGIIGVGKGEDKSVDQGGTGTNDTNSSTNNSKGGFIASTPAITTNALSTNASSNTGAPPETRVSVTNQASKTNAAGSRASPEANKAEMKMTFWEAFRAGLTVWGTYFVVLFAGTIGALISVLRRIQKMTLDGDSDTNLVELEQNSASIDFSPLLGAVFALLLLFMIMSGLLSGDLFPKLPTKPNDMFFLGCVPSDCPQVAKLIVWAFIAGFAEKFVPDALDRLQSRSTTPEKTAPSKQS